MYALVTKKTKQTKTRKLKGQNPQKEKDEFLQV